MFLCLLSCHVTLMAMINPFLYLLAAMLCRVMHGWLSIFSGQPLRKISRFLEESSSTMKDHNTISTLRTIEIQQQAVGSLLGDDTSQRNDGYFDKYTENSLHTDGHFKFNKLFCSVYLNNNELAWEISEKLTFQMVAKLFRGSIWPFIFSFYRGMNAFGEF